MMMMKVLRLGSCSFLTASATAIVTVPEPLTVHILPHTHDDVGWLKTVDQYLLGQNNTIQSAGVNDILDSVTKALPKDRKRKFQYVEQAFFQRWWAHQTVAVQDTIRNMIKNKQLHFLNGAWSMHDEAAAFYIDMIDNTELGHYFLLKEFGVKPTVGWQIDPFGHSLIQASLLSAEVGFIGLFFGRLDYQDLAFRKASRSAEFIWKSHEDKTSVFTGLTGQYNGNYGAPDGFCWDRLCDPSKNPRFGPDDAKNQEIVDKFVQFAKVQQAETRGNHILMTFGNDFLFSEAEINFENIDQLITKVNEGSEDYGMKLQYSDMETYVLAKQNEQPKDTLADIVGSIPSLLASFLSNKMFPLDDGWPVKDGTDFFPYADGANMFWTGYFTSRPGLKRMIRDYSAKFQTIKTLAALSQVQNKKILNFADAMGIVQHHDAISGTAKQHVTFDYQKRIHAGYVSASDIALSSETWSKLGAETSPLVECLRKNETVCASTKALEEGSDAVHFYVWNNLAQARTVHVELPVPLQALQVHDESDGSVVPSHVLQAFQNVGDYGTLSFAEGALPYVIEFTVSLPALGYGSFTLRKTPTPGTCATETETVSSETPTTFVETLSTGPFVVNLGKDQMKGLITLGVTDRDRVTLCADGRICQIGAMKAEQDYKIYRGIEANKWQNDGAYIFRPREQPTTLKISRIELVRDAKTTEILEVRQYWEGNYISQRIKVMSPDGGSDSVLEITHVSGPLPNATQLVTNWQTSLDTTVEGEVVFYTDANGRQMVKRVLNGGRDWPNFEQTEPVAGNYNPITVAALIRDEGKNSNFVILTDAAQGAASLQSGHLEVMIHRTTDHDDKRGVGEPLRETQYITPYEGGSIPGGEHYGPLLRSTGKHWIRLAADDSWRRHIDQMYWQPTVYFSGKDSREEKTKAEEANAEEALGEAKAEKAPEGAPEKAKAAQDEADTCVQGCTCKQNARGSNVDQTAKKSFLSAPLQWELQIISLEPLNHLPLILDSSKYVNYQGLLFFDENSNADLSGVSGTIGEKRGQYTLLIRLAHQYSTSKINVDLAKLFANHAWGSLIQVEELNLSANQLRKDMPSWKNTKPPREPITVDFKTAIRPWEIRTFAMVFENDPPEVILD